MTKQNRSTHRCFLLSLVLLLALTLLQVSPAAAADTVGRITLSAPDLSQYPIVHFSFWPFDQDGKFVNTVSASSLYIFENDQQVKVDDLQLTEPGTHIVLAVNEGPTLGNSYAGKVRLDTIKQAWIEWAADQSITTMDDFSLVNNDSVLNDQLSKPADWVDALEAYQPNMDSATPSMNSLSLSLEKLANISDGKNKALLLITPLPSEEQLSGMQDLFSQATASDIHLFIWLVGPQSYASEAGTAILEQLAASSGGEFFLFSGAEELPSLSTYLDPLRFEYTATYTTALLTSGTYTLAVRVDQNNFQQTSEKASFELIVLPANPIFLSPPSTITRTWVQDTGTRRWSLVPSQQTIRFLVEFPDGHTRALTSSELLIDGSVAAKNTAEPFDEFVWDLSSYTSSGNHTMQIRVTDSVGLSASTIEMPVDIEVDQKPLGFVGRFIQQIGWQTIGISIFLLLTAVGLVFLFLRLRLRTPVRQNAFKKVYGQSTVVENSKTSPSNTRPQTRNAAYARLVFLGGMESSLALNSVFNISGSVITIGNDSVRCQIVPGAPSVSPLHAEISVDAAGQCFLADRGSAAGTWLNYTPVSSQGTQLENGDRIHIGGCEFRFEMSGGQQKKARIEPYLG